MDHLAIYFRTGYGHPSGQAISFQPETRESMLSQDPNIATKLDLNTSFQALARDILEVDRAILAPAGGSSTLVQSQFILSCEHSCPGNPTRDHECRQCEDFRGIGFRLPRRKAEVLPGSYLYGVNGG